MSVNNSTVILNGCIDKFKEEYELSLEESKIFELFSLVQIMKVEPSIGFNDIMDSLTDGAQDGGIDSIVLIHNGENVGEDEDIKASPYSVTKFFISQCKTEKSFKESSIDKLITSLSVLFDLNKEEGTLAKRFNSQILGKIKTLRSLWKKTSSVGGKIEVYINYACKAPEIVISSAFESKCKQLEDLCRKSFPASSVKICCYGSPDLLDLFQKRRACTHTLIFKDQPLSVNYNDSGLGYIGLVRLSDYKSFLTLEDGCINEELFESNIRHFQGNVDVNKKIKNTLECVSDEDFWWLNNGITIIAESPNQLGKSLILQNVQIVNGLQTSYSIYNLGNQCDVSTDERSVLVKVIISSEKNVVDDIIEATNFQNAVSPGLLRATEPIQKEIELYFSHKGYFYDRRKNYYKNRGAPGSKIFSIQFLAQAIKAIVLKDPHTARATPTSLLKTAATYAAIFRQKDDYAAYLNCCLIVSKIHQHILGVKDKEIKGNLLHFKFHLAVIVTCFCLDKLDYSMDEISKINVISINEDYIGNSIFFLGNLLKKYRESHPHSNLINVSKSSEFTDILKDAIRNLKLCPTSQNLR